MGRKADEFKAAEQLKRSAAKPKKPPKRHGPASPRPAVPNPAAHNASQHADKKARYKLELSATARPSRKSTRKSGHRQKTDSPLRISEIRRAAQPSKATRPSDRRS